MAKIEFFQFGLRFFVSNQYETIDFLRGHMFFMVEMTGMFLFKIDISRVDSRMK